MSTGLLSRPVEPPASAARPRPPVIDAAIAVAGLALAYVTGRDGSLGWQVVRVLAVAALTAAAVTMRRRAGPRLRQLTSYAVGLVATTVGAGIGFPSARKEGLSLGTVAGLVAFAAGVVLLVTATAALTRTTRGRRRWLVPPAALVVTVLGVLIVTPAIYVTNVPGTSLGSATPADRGLAYAGVTFRTSDGVTLSGWYVPSANRAAVALLHGAGSTRSNVLAQATVLARAGYGVLLYDARGHGRSGGRAMDYGWYGDRDITAAVSFLAGRSDVDPARIGVVGMSMGGEQAIGAAAADDRIRAVVSEGGYVRTAADLDWLSEEYGVRGALQEQLSRLGMGLAALLTDAPRPARLRDAVAAAAPTPMLLIAAGEISDEGTAMRWIRRGAPGTVEVWEVPGAGHTDGLATRPAEWTARVTGFLGDVLLPK